MAYELKYLGRSALALICAGAFLGGCSEVQRTAVDTTDRAARTVVTKTLATDFPLVPKALMVPFTSCIMSNANPSEKRTLAGDTVLGIDAGTVALIKSILSRPETATCLNSAAPGAGVTL